MSGFEALHWVAKRSFEAKGYTWEALRSGDATLGLWRIPLKARAQRSWWAPRRLVVIPGFGDTSLSWFPLVALLKRVLSQGLDEVVIVDFPGYPGFLSHARCFASMDEMLAVIRGTLNELSPQMILGQSLGAWLAADYAASGAESLKELILCSPSGVFGSEKARSRWRGYFTRAMQEGLHTLSSRMFYREPLLYKIFARDLEGFPQRRDVMEFMLSVEPRHEVGEKLGDIRCRVWLGWGELDRLSRPSWSKYWIRGLAHTQVQAWKVPGVGHSMHVESPARTCALLKKIFRSILPAKPELLPQLSWRGRWEPVRIQNLPDGKSSSLAEGAGTSPQSSYPNEAPLLHPRSARY